MNKQSSTLPDQSFLLKPPSSLSQEDKEKQDAQFQFPPFREFNVRHECLEGVKLPLGRVNTLLIRPYKSAGFTESGIYIERKSGRPSIWGHVLALHESLTAYSYPIRLSPGDHILYSRYAEEELFTVKSLDPIMEGETLPVCILHVEAIQCVFRPNLVEMRI